MVLVFEVPGIWEDALVLSFSEAVEQTHTQNLHENKAIVKKNPKKPPFIDFAAASVKCRDKDHKEAPIYEGTKRFGCV